MENECKEKFKLCFHQSLYSVCVILEYISIYDE